MSLVTLRTFDSPIQANLIKTKLSSEGVDSVLFDEFSVSINPLYSNTLGGIKLKVRSEDYQKAIALVEALDQRPFIDANGNVLTCPNCGGTNFYSGFKSYKSLRGILSFVTTFLLGVFPFFFSTVYRCKSCDTEFENNK